MTSLRSAFFSLLIMGMLAAYASGQGQSRGGQGGRNGQRGAPKWGTRGGNKGGKKGGQSGGRRGPPKESIPACKDLEAKAECTFKSPRGHDVTGICVPMPGRGSSQNNGQLHCRPEGNRGGGGAGARRRAQAPGRGPSPSPGRGPSPPPGRGPSPGVKPGPRPRQPLTLTRRNSSLEACAGKSVEDACLFRPPVMGDQEARGFMRNGRLLQQGRKGGGRKGGWNKRREDWKKRRGPPKAARPARAGVCVPWNQTDGTTTNFCRALPPDAAIPACDTLNEGDKCHFITNGSEVYVNLKVSTGKQAMAETTGDVLASFFVNGEWTDPELFFTGSEQGQENEKTFLMNGWPRRVTLTIWSNDAWCFWKVQVNNTVILKDPAGETGSDSYSKDDDDESFSDSRFWIEGPPSSQIFDVPSGLTARPSGQQSVKLRIYTGSSAQAGTNGSIFASFMVQEKWTEPELLFAGAKASEEKEKTFQVSSFPEKVWISSNSSDPYGYWKISINEIDVIEDPAGSGGSQEYDEIGSLEEAEKFWIASPPASQSFAIPARPTPRGSRKHRVRGTCQETWWDMMNGTLHCRPSNKEWKPPTGPKNGVRNQGNKRESNRMEPDWSVKSDAPEKAESEPIEVKMIVKNLNYDELMANARMRRDFEMRTKRVIAGEAGQGVYPNHVTLKLSKGSVIIHASINPPEYISRSYLQKQLAEPSVATALAKTLEAVPGISGVSVGQPTVTMPSQQGRTGKGGSKDDDDDEEIAVLVGVAGGASVLVICMCVVVCVLMKRLRSQKANPQINGTTVAIGRPVEAGQTNEATAGIPVNAGDAGKDPTYVTADAK